MAELTYKRVLVPTDMSDFSALALKYAAAFRERLRSSLTLLYADELFSTSSMLEFPLGYWLENAPQSRDQVRERLRAYGEARIGVPFETQVAVDAPTRAILDAAAHADLVIMGTHGRRGLRRALLGSVTENVLHETDVPVLTVTPGLMNPARDVAIRRILCPVNFTRIARESLAHACALAEAFAADLHVIYVAETLDRARAMEVENAFRQWIDPQVADRCRFAPRLEYDEDPAEKVLVVANDIAADLIVIGAQHRFFSDATVIGTTTQRITRFARVPVLTIARKAQSEIALPAAPETAAVM